MKMIRKMAALLIVLSMCIIFPCAAFAAPAHCDSTDSTTLVAEPVSLPSPSFSQSPSQVAPVGSSKNFSCGSGHFAEPLQSDYYVIQGSTKLKITSMTWNPAVCDITIGFFPSGINRYRTIWSQTFRWFSPQSDYNYRKCPHWNVLDLRLQQR